MEVLLRYKALKVLFPLILVVCMATPVQAIHTIEEVETVEEVKFIEQAHGSQEQIPSKKSQKNARRSSSLIHELAGSWSVYLPNQKYLLHCELIFYE